MQLPKAVIASLPTVSDEEALAFGLTIYPPKPSKPRIDKRFVDDRAKAIYRNRDQALDEATLAADKAYLFHSTILRVGSDGQVAVRYFGSAEEARDAWAVVLNVSNELEQEERETVIANGYHSAIFA